MHTEASYERRGYRPRPPFRRRNKSRHPGLAERDTPREAPKPKGEIPASFADNVFGLVHPLIQHAVDEAKAAGIEMFCFVTSRGKTPLEDHFDLNYELNATLKARNKAAVFQSPSAPNP